MEVYVAGGLVFTGALLGSNPFPLPAVNFPFSFPLPLLFGFRLHFPLDVLVSLEDSTF